MLCVKNPAIFTALLEHLVMRFPCFALIHNPLAILGSWNSIPFKWRKGRAPAAERFDAELVQALATAKDKIARQLALLAWYYRKYRDVLPPSAIIRYEDIVASGGKALRVITASAETLSEPLESRNQSWLHDWKRLQTLGERLLRADGAFWHFYSKASVEELLTHGRPVR